MSKEQRMKWNEWVSIGSGGEERREKRDQYIPAFT
jgi:hypothetical protein